METGVRRESGGKSIARERDMGKGKMEDGTGIRVVPRNTR